MREEKEVVEEEEEGNEEKEEEVIKIIEEKKNGEGEMEDGEMIGNGDIKRSIEWIGKGIGEKKEVEIRIR